MKTIKPDKDLIKLSILVMESLVSTEVKERFLLTMIFPKIAFEKGEKFSIKNLKEMYGR